jgi:beta-galactosidase
VAEAAQIGRELAQAGPAIAGSTYQASVAIVKDYDNEWDGELDSWHGPYERASTTAWFKALQHSHIPADMIYLRPVTTAADLARYRCLIYTHPTIMTDETAAVLRAYVEEGGTLILGCRTGYKDARGHCYMRPMPGPVADLCGVTVEDFTRIGPYQQAPSLRCEAAQQGDRLVADAFNDILQVEAGAVEVVATFGADARYYAGKPALMRHPTGRGATYYYGAVFNATVARTMIEHLELRSPVAAQCTLTNDIEVAIRENEEGDRLIFLLNYAGTPQSIRLHQPATDLLTGEQHEGDISVGGYEVLLLRFG